MLLVDIPCIRFKSITDNQTIHISVLCIPQPNLLRNNPDPHHHHFFLKIKTHNNLAEVSTMGPPNPIYDLDSRLRDLQAAVEDVVTTARAEHSRLCREELLLFTSFMHNEGISRADSFSSLVSLFTAAKPLLGNAIQDLAWMREERRDLHEKYKNSLEENIKEVHLQLVGHAVESGRR